jgi:signal transduction histidine kinase
MTRDFESDIFRIGLVTSALYLMLQFVRDLVTSAPIINMLINLFSIVVIVLMLYLSNYTKLYKWVNITFFLLLLLPLLSFFWIRYNGINGSVPYFFILYFLFATVSSSGITGLIAVSSGLVMLILLVMFPALFSTTRFVFPIEEIQLSIDFFITCLLLAVFTLYVRKKFDHYRTQAEHRNSQLEKIAITLTEQHEILVCEQSEIESINNNLEKLIHERTQQIEDTNKALSEYAFINAHMLRAPLSRIIGLSDLMERDAVNGSKKKILEIKELAGSMDQVVRKITDVLT